jgi:hypothetical protein
MDVAHEIDDCAPNNIGNLWEYDFDYILGDICVWIFKKNPSEFLLH